MKKLLLVFFLLSNVFVEAQQGSAIVSGPMLGQVELRTASIWIEVRPGSTADLQYWKKGQPRRSQTIQMRTDPNAWFTPLTFQLPALDMNTDYEYNITVGSSRKTGSFKTKDLWEWRKPAPDFSFLAGSCAYFNDPQYDRPGKPYGGDSSIFEAMAKEKSAFMIWLGDNWYTREADYGSAWGLWYRASHDRSLPVLQPFLKSMPQYAIWDDHDYGPDNADKSFGLAPVSRKIFTSYWNNPFFGQKEEGIYTKISYGDVDLFLLDDRSFRSADDLESEVNGHLNSEKRMWGEKQLDWLKNGLAGSRATFKIIVSGSQFLNTLSTSDCLSVYPVEFNELMGFLEKQQVEGVVFLSGDRHHSEVIQYKRAGAYTLYDITTSPLTAGVSRVSGNQVDHPNRIPGTLVQQQSYARFSISGAKGERSLRVEFSGLHGEKLAEWSVNQKQLLNP